MTFVETSLFTKLVYNYLADAEYSVLQFLLTLHPEAGDMFLGAVASASWRILGGYG